MTKRIETPPPEETVTIPKSSFDAIFRTMEEMRDEIASLRTRLDDKMNRLYSREEAAKFCGVSVWTINNYRKQGIIHKVVQGCRTGYLEKDLLKVRKIKGAN